MSQKNVSRTQPQTVQVKVAVSALVHAELKAGGYSAEVPALPGCYTQGETIEEVKSNLREAIEGWIAVAHDEAVTITSAKRKRP